MERPSNIIVIVETAVTAIQKAAGLVAEMDSGINDVQIKQLRDAIDKLENNLNAKKRDLNASRS